MKSSFWLALLVILSLPCFADPLKLAGTFTLIDGNVSVNALDGTSRGATVGGSVYVGETIETSAASEAQLSMVDSSLIALRQKTKLVVTDYRAEGDKADRSTLDLLAGSIRTVTGWIAQFNRPKYTIRVATATVGIRGTDHEVALIDDGSSEEHGVYSRVFEGGTTVNTPKGQVNVTPGKASFFATHGRDRPRLLAQIPQRLAAGRHDGQFEGKRALLRAKFKEHRAARIAEIRKHRAAQRKARFEAGNAPAAKQSDQLKHARERLEGKNAERQLRQDRHNPPHGSKQGHEHK
jgi:hypothetical protein